MTKKKPTIRSIAGARGFPWHELKVGQTAKVDGGVKTGTINAANAWADRRCRNARFQLLPIKGDSRNWLIKRLPDREPLALGSASLREFFRG